MRSWISWATPRLVLQNNEPEDAAEIVLDHLLKAPESVHSLYEKIFDGSTNDALKNAVKDELARWRWLIFSDTILIANAYESDDSEVARGARWVPFLYALSMLYRHLFENGLPIRGGVCYGRFLIKESCFAGRSIIAAYQLANNLETRGCSATSKCHGRALQALVRRLREKTW